MININKKDITSIQALGHEITSVYVGDKLVWGIGGLISAVDPSTSAGSNFLTNDGYVIITSDGLVFNVKE